MSQHRFPPKYPAWYSVAYQTETQTSARHQIQGGFLTDDWDKTKTKDITSQQSEQTQLMERSNQNSKQKQPSGAKVSLVSKLLSPRNQIDTQIF